MEPVPTINRALFIAQQIEKQKEISCVRDVGESSALYAQRFNQGSFGESSAMAAQRYNQGGMGVGTLRFQGKRDWKKEKFNKKCNHRGGKGHTIEQCFKLITYPEWYSAIKLARGTNANNGGGRNFAANVHVNSEVAQADSPLDFEDNLTGMLEVK